MGKEMRGGFSLPKALYSFGTGEHGRGAAAVLGMTLMANIAIVPVVQKKQLRLNPSLIY